MKHPLPFRSAPLAGITALAAILLLFAVRSDAAESRKLCIAIIGDSTVCDYKPEHPCRGWGQFLHEYFNDSVRIANHAASGRSTKTFIAEGRWKRTLDEKPDFILIQFGHNDSHAAGRPESTDAATDYRGFLRRYIDEARAAGAAPILVIPMHRRTFDAGGRLTDILRPYAEAMRAVAAEKNAPLIDLHTPSGRFFQELGETRCPELANSPEDRTHFNEKGARMMADMAMQQLPAAAPRLASEMKPPTR
ncbi:MAG: rhamnogalacturonan acetylesterase [Chthoniobacteraceae bacterium]